MTMQPGTMQPTPMKRPRNARDDEGFTLIELLVVILIIGILTAIAIPVFLGQQAQANKASVENDAHNLTITIQSKTTADSDFELPLDDADVLLSQGNALTIIYMPGEPEYVAVFASDRLPAAEQYVVTNTSVGNPGWVQMDGASRPAIIDDMIAAGAELANYSNSEVIVYP